jgi:fumarylacetoacetase
MNIKANDPKLTSWVNIPKNSDFPIQNLPFGIFKTKEKTPRVGVAIGEQIIDLLILFELGYLEGLSLKKSDLSTNFLNDLMLHGKLKNRALRNRLSDLFEFGNQTLQNNKDHISKILVSQKEVNMMMPLKIGDYTDFYSSEQHAYNVGCMFRDPKNALLPNWKYIPVGYHGRASSIILSGEPIHRPKGQKQPNENEPPIFGPSNLLDFELEMAFITYQGKPLGQSITTSEAEDYIFGMVIFNDWSARDLQKWEYVPLGPFLAKNFASSISPWIVTLDALEPFRVAGTPQIPEVFDYLKFEGNKNIDIQLQVALTPENSQENIISNSNYKYMYWNMNQQLAHHTINGCNINCGDMMASGTISGPEETSYGSMLELSWKGTKPIKLNNGSERKFIQDGDTITMRAYTEKNNVRVGFGEVSTKILPAI